LFVVDPRQKAKVEALLQGRNREALEQESSKKLA
jgi:hypothetical protein